jgi:levansucrase
LPDRAASAGSAGSPAQEARARWTRAQVAQIRVDPAQQIPLISSGDVQPIAPGVDFWDMWPVQRRDGSVARFDGVELWMALSAPALADPAARHDLARIRLLSLKGGVYRDDGDVLPKDFSPGSREWAGSAVVDDGAGSVTLYFTAAGRRGEKQPSFEQRLFETTAPLVSRPGKPFGFGAWTAPIESFRADGAEYVSTALEPGEPGYIKAFRDPAYFRDPLDGAEYLLFAASLKRSNSRWNGAIGIARREGASWRLCPPLLSADELNNELERPHVIARDGGYYLFWSTQRHMFDPAGPSGPNGLYGMRAPSLFGPYEPLNGGGLIAGNPEAEPFQTYSWLVLDTLEVVSFIDYWGMEGRSLTSHPDLKRSRFGGAPAPRFRIVLQGRKARVG